MTSRMTLIEWREGGRANSIPPTYRFLALLLLCSIMITPAIGFPNPGHPANEIGPGVFGPGDFLINGSLNTSGSINSQAGIDLAEAFEHQGEVLAAEIVSAVDGDTVERATNATALYTVGVVSTQPGMTLNKPGLTDPVYIAVSGRVPVKIKGFVQRGDYITVSDIPGVGVAADSPDFVVGRALEDSNGPTATILVEPGYFSPQIDQNNSLIGAPHRSIAHAASTASAAGYVGHPEVEARLASIERQLNITAALEERITQLQTQLAQRDAMLADLSERIVELQQARGEEPDVPAMPDPIHNETEPPVNQTPGNRTPDDTAAEYILGTEGTVQTVGYGDIQQVTRRGGDVVITLT